MAGKVGELACEHRTCLVVSPHLDAADSAKLLNLPVDTHLLMAPRTNPSIDDLQAMAPVWPSIAAASDLVIAIGGGTAIDYAKALASSAGDIASLLAHVREGRSLPAAALPLIAVPTTAGTGSEVTPWATLWSREDRKKYSLHTPACWPRHAVVDPLLLTGCPAAVSTASGLDALSHALESVWNHHANPVSDALAMRAAQGIVQNLPRWLEDGDTAARDALSRSALLAGMAFSQTRTALAHALSYDITLSRGTAHGIACSFSLPEVWRRAVAASPGRMAVLEPLFGTLSAEPLAAFLESLGVDTQFSTYGIDDIDRAVDAVLHSPRGRNFIGAPAHA